MEEKKFLTSPNINSAKNLEIPENTIAVFRNDPLNSIPTYNQLMSLIQSSKGNIKRDWFPENAYRCRPLPTANEYGFILKTEFEFTVEWNGNENTEDLTFLFNEPLEDVNSKYFTNVSSHFGSGIITISVPCVLRTPPGIDLLVTAPPNYMLPGLRPMSAIIETDNLRSHFTFNFKVEIPRSSITIKSGTPVAWIMPIQRNFANNFSFAPAEDIFEKNILDIEEDYQKEFAKTRLSLRSVPEKKPLVYDRTYKSKMDIYGNKFNN